MKRTVFIILNILICSYVFPQAITVSSSQLNFGNAYENSPDSLQLTLFNNSGHDVNVTGIKFYNTYGSPAFSAIANAFTVANSSSAIVWIKFSPNHNIFHNSELVIENDGLRGYTSVDLVGQGKYSNTYYDASENLSEEALKTSLHDITGLNYFSLLYNPARDLMFMQIDNKMVNGQGASQNTIEGVYTGIQAVGYIDRTDCQTNYGFNTEHTFPQSLFNSFEPMKSDLHQIFPTDDASNTVRGNNPFGEVTNPTWSGGGSLSDANLFEPRDVHKGAAARAMFYFVLRYQNYNNFLNSQESTLRLWNKNFLPSQIEKVRNNDIYAAQQNRNPFVDYPQFADRITSISNFSTAPVISSIDIPQDTIIYGFVQQSVSNIFHFVIVNRGNTDAHFNNFTLSHPGILSFQSGGSNATLSPGESLGIDINCFVTTPDSIHGWLSFNTDVPGNGFVNIPIYVNDPVFTTIQENSSPVFSVYPNPVTNSLTIQTDNNFISDSKITVSDVFGRNVFTREQKGSNNIIIDFSLLPAGAYFVRCENKSDGRFSYHSIVKL